MAAPRPAPRRGTESEIQEDLVELLYVAAADLDAWPAALDLLATWTHAASAAIVVRDRVGSKRPRLWKQVGALPARVVLETVGNAWYHAPGDALRILVANGQPSPHVVGSTLPLDAGTEATLLLTRELDDEAFTPQELTRAAALLPHLRRAVTIALRVERLVHERDGLAEALDRIPIGALLVTRDGRIVRANASARTIVTARDGLAVVAGVLGAQNAGDGPALRRMLRHACLPDGGARPACPPPLLHIRRASLRRPYCVAVVGLAGADPAGADDEPTALVLVSDPDGDVGMLTAVIRELYGLTPTEGHVATMLLQGTGVEAIATSSAVSLNTVRTHLKRTFSKVEVGSQCDLVRVLLAGPARVVPRAVALDAPR